MAYRIANVGKTGILKIIKNGLNLARYRADLGDAEIDVLDYVGVNLFQHLEQGAINNSTGEPTDGYTRCRSDNFVEVIKDLDIVITKASDIKMAIFRYDANKAYIDWDSRLWNNISTVGYIYNVPNDTKYIKIIVAKIDDSECYPSDFENNTMLSVRSNAQFDIDMTTVENDGYLSIQDCYKEELSHNLYEFASGKPITLAQYVGIQKKYPVKVGDVIYLEFATTNNSPWFAITKYNSYGSYDSIFYKAYGTSYKGVVDFDGYVSFVLWTSDAEFLLSKLSKLRFFTHYVTPNNKLTDITAIGTDESGNTTASRSYAQGDIFYKDGFIGEALTAVASGATWTLNTNYKQTTLAEIVAALRA